MSFAQGLSLLHTMHKNNLIGTYKENSRRKSCARGLRPRSFFFNGVANVVRTMLYIPKKILKINIVAGHLFDGYLYFFLSLYHVHKQ